jgi:hypothetical protein
MIGDFGADGDPAKSKAAKSEAAKVQSGRLQLGCFIRASADRPCFKLFGASMIFSESRYPLFGIML